MILALIFFLITVNAITIRDKNVVFEFNDEIPSVGIARDEYPNFRFLFTPTTIAEVTPDGNSVETYSLTGDYYEVHQGTKFTGVEYTMANPKFSMQLKFTILDFTDSFPNWLTPWITVNRWNFTSINNSIALSGKFQIFQNGTDVSQYTLWSGQSKLISLTGKFIMGISLDTYVIAPGAGWNNCYGSFIFNYTENTYTFVIPGSQSWLSSGFGTTPVCFIPDYDQTTAPTGPAINSGPTTMPQEKAIIIGLGTTASFLFFLIIVILLSYLFPEYILTFILGLFIMVGIVAAALVISYVKCDGNCE